MAVRASIPLTLLVVGDDPSAVQSALDGAAEGSVDGEIEAVPDASAAEEYLADEAPDCVVVAADGDATDVATLADADAPTVAIAGDEAAATAALDAGATEYVLRSIAADRPALLGRRIRRAVDEATETGLPGSSGWYEALLQDSMDALTVVAADGTIAYQSPSVERLLGYAPRELIDTDSLSYVHPDDREEVRATFERLYAAGDGASEELEFRFRNAEGDWEWLESVVTTRLDPGIAGFVVNTRLITQRKAREREVDRYETLLSVLPDTIVITDGEGYMEDIYGYEGWSGYDKDELVGAHVTETTPEEDLERAWEVTVELLDDPDREKAIYESHVETKGGETIPVENHVTPLPPDDDGEIPGTMSVLRDVSERKERERYLQQAETVFQNVPDGVYLMDVTDDGEFEHRRVNAAFEEITGLTEEDVRGKTLAEVVGDDGMRAEIEAAMEDVVERRSPRHREREIEGEDGSTYWETWIAPVVVEDEVDSLVGVIRDVTERKRRQREIELKNRAMDEAPIGISISEVADEAIGVTYVNSGFERLTGYDATDFDAPDVEGAWELVMGEETDEATVEEFATAIENGEAASDELLIYRKDGVPRWCQVSLSPLDEGGQLSHVVAFQQDITDLKEYETEIERRFDEFSEVFAEDLRDPLEAAQEALEAARRNGDDGAVEEAAEWIERTDGLLSDLATVHSFSVPSRDRSESALLGVTDGE